MMLLQLAFVCAIACMQGNTVGAIECYSCTNTSSLPSCTTIMSCPVDSTCSSEYTTSNGIRLYTLGCRYIMSCPISSTPFSGTSSLVGRRAAVTTNCSECCHFNHCNRQLCQDPDEKCADAETYNCAQFGSIVDICDANSHIKPYCKRFCGFCNTVDGGWSHWSAWSICDVTCGNGTRTKIRTCVDPPPANGGSDCVGAKETHEQCSKMLCPIHGGWSQWSPWGPCSVTCDVGLQRMDRTCTNPHPALFGDNCYGDSRSDRMCFPGACANGSWSSWSLWGSCDKTCDGGVRSRTRNCDNPAPSLTGLDCPGQTSNAESCNAYPCHGRQDPVVFFAKELPGGAGQLSLGSNAILRFINVITNVGHGYDSSTGIFTAPVNGTYSFNVQICAQKLQYADAGLLVNGVRITNLVTISSSEATCRTLSLSVILKQGDKVQAKTDSISRSQYFYQDQYRINSFGGTLIQLIN